MNIAIGWRFYSADFSLNAGDPARMAHGTVMLIRDPVQRESWNNMNDAQREEYALFVTGRGVDLHSALRDANSSALSQKKVE